jgi:hypothetical protein
MRVWLACLVGVGQAWCQQNEVSLRIDFVAWGDDIPGLVVKSGSKRTPVTALGFRYSAPVNYSGPAVMEIHKSGEATAAQPLAQSSPEDKDHQLMPLIAEEPSDEANQAPNGNKWLTLLHQRREKEPQLAALCPLPQGSRHVTVLLVPAGSFTYHCHVINDDPSTLPPGSLRIHNLTPLSIAMRSTGNLRKTLKPRESLLARNENQRFIYEVAYERDGEWIIQENNIISAPDNEQIQMIVLKSDHSYFRSSDGSSGGFLQIVTLRRKAAAN